MWIGCERQARNRPPDGQRCRIGTRSAVLMRYRFTRDLLGRGLSALAERADRDSSLPRFGRLRCEESNVDCDNFVRRDRWHGDFHPFAILTEGWR